MIWGFEDEMCTTETRVYNTDAIQIHKIDEIGHIYARLSKSDGNIITKYSHYNIGATTLIERHYDGTIVREYRTNQRTTDYFLDKYGRFVVCNACGDFLFLDPEFNHLNSVVKFVSNETI